jgi:hypothetical protein
MHHRQRIIGDFHVELGKVAPGSPDQIERAIGQALGRVVAFQAAKRNLVSAFGVALGLFLQTNDAELVGNPLPDKARLHLDQFQASAAEIADNAIGLEEPRLDTKGSRARLFIAGKNGERR